MIHLSLRGTLAASVALGASLLSPVDAQTGASCRSAASFDGIDDYLSVPTSSALQNPSAMTVEAWVLRRANGGAIVEKGDGLSSTSERSYDIRLQSSGAPCFWFFLDAGSSRNAVALCAQEALPVGQWGHLAMTFDSSSGEFVCYLNGKELHRASSLQDGTPLAGMTIRQTTRDLTIGAQPRYSNQFFNGHIDMVRIWNRARSETELQSAMYQRLGATAGLVAEYALDGDLLNGAGSTHHATARNGAALSNGCATVAKECSTYLTLSGSGEWVRVPHSPVLRNPTAMTAEAWVKPRPGSTGSVLNMGDGFNSTSDRAFDLSIANGQVIAWYFLGQVGTGTAVAVYSGLRVPADEWCHIASTYDAATGEMRLYINGAFAGRDTESPALPIRASGRPLEIGARPPFSNQLFPGDFDEVRIWSVVRTEQEIRASMGSRLTGSPTGIEAVFHLDGNLLEDQQRHTASALGSIRYIAGCATNLAYGRGTPGTNGVPSFESDPLRLGQSAQLRYGNSSGQPVTGVIAFGSSTASIPIAGGTLLTPPVHTASVSIPSNGGSTVVSVPNTAAIAGTTLYMQIVQFDFGVPGLLSFSPGIAATFGN